MEAQHKVVDRLHELTGSVTVSAKEGVAAAFNLSTPDPAVALAVVRVVGVTILAVVGISAVVMLTCGFPRQQSAALALVEDDGGRLAAEA
jgi:hypothetical protein